MHKIEVTLSQVRNAQGSDRFVLLDFIRSTAIVLLLIAHISQTIGSPLGRSFGIPNFYYVSTGGFAVTIFLVLSGLALELNYRGRDVRYCYFMIARVLRIYPAYYLSLLVGFIASAIISLSNSLSMSVPHILSPHTFNTISSELSPSLFLGIITGLQSLWGGWPLGVNKLVHRIDNEHVSDLSSCFTKCKKSPTYYSYHLIWSKCTVSCFTWSI